MPKVSICIPAYKNPEFLIRAVDSVLIQSFKDYEIIITDDTPDDSLGNVVKHKYANVKNLGYYKNPERLGSTVNWNYAISLAKTDLIKLLHHDDWFSTGNSLKDLISPILENLEIDFVFCQSNLYDDKKLLKIQKPSGKDIKIFNDDHAHILFKNFIAPSSTLFRQRNIIFDSRLTWLPDVDFYVRYLEYSSFYYIERPLVNLNVSKGRLTSSCLSDSQLLVNELIYLFNKYGMSSSAKKNILKYFRWVIKSYSLCDIKRLKYQSELIEIPGEFEEMIQNLTFSERLCDLSFRAARKIKRSLLNDIL